MKFGSITGKSQPISIGVSDHHLSGLPWGVFRRLCDCDLSCEKMLIAVVYICNMKVDSTTYLAVFSVFREEDGLVIARDLEKLRKSRLKLMMPVNGEA